MSAFVGDPTGPFWGQCQNQFYTWDGPKITSSTRCDQPVMALGGAVPGRDICQVCRASTEAKGRAMIAEFASNLTDRGRAEWIERARATLADMWASYYRRAAQRAPMADLYDIRRDIERREEILAAVLAVQGVADNVCEAGHTAGR
jgi:hypothetical protein